MKLTPRERERRADEHGAKARTLRLASRPAEAMEHADQGVALVEGLLAERPGDPNTLSVLAAHLYNRAAIHEQLGQPERGIPDARRSIELYQRLIPLDASVAAFDRRAEPQAADAQARLARLLALAPSDTIPGSATEIRQTIARAAATYVRLTEADQRYRPALARMLFSEAEVLRILAEATGVQPPAQVLLSYTGAVDLYDALGDQQSDEDRSYHALALLRTARMYRHPDAGLVDMLAAARAAADLLFELVMDGHGGHGDCVAALHLLAEIMRSKQMQDWEEPLLAAQAVLSRMRPPLDEETASLERDIQRQLRSTGP